MRVADHLLDVVRRPAAGGIAAAAIAEGMDADRQVGRRRSLVDRPVAPLAERFGGGVSSITWAKFASPARARSCSPIRAVLERHHDRRLQPQIARRPFRHLPFVGGMA